MRIEEKNVSVPGIFIYKPDLTYEPGDMIIHDDILYIVTNTYSYEDGREPGDVPQCCKPYTEYHGYNNEPSDDEEQERDQDQKIITASNLRTIINTMFKGLSLEGVISPLETSKVNLDDYKDTGAYLLVVDNSITNKSLPQKLTNSRALLRIYRSGTIIVQEVIDYELPIIYYRYYYDKNWYGWYDISNGDDNTVKQFKAIIKQYQNKISEYANKIEQIEDESRIYIKEVTDYDSPQTSININVTKGSTLQVGFMLKDSESAIPLQEWVTIDLSSTNTGIACSSSKSGVFFNVSNSIDNISTLELMLKSFDDDSKMYVDFVRKPTDTISGIFKVLRLGKY